MLKKKIIEKKWEKWIFVIEFKLSDERKWFKKIKLKIQMAYDENLNLNLFPKMEWNFLLDQNEEIKREASEEFACESVSWNVMDGIFCLIKIMKRKKKSVWGRKWSKLDSESETTVLNM